MLVLSVSSVHVQEKKQQINDKAKYKPQRIPTCWIAHPHHFSLHSTYNALLAKSISTNDQQKKQQQLLQFNPINYLETEWIHPHQKWCPSIRLVRFCLYPTTPTIDAFIYQHIRRRWRPILPVFRRIHIGGCPLPQIQQFALFWPSGSAYSPNQKLLYSRSWRWNRKKRAFRTSLPSFHPHKLIHRPNLDFSHFCLFWQRTNICLDKYKYITICPEL